MMQKTSSAGLTVRMEMTATAMAAKVFQTTISRSTVTMTPLMENK